MPLKFINLNSPPVVAVNSGNGRALGKEKWHRKSLERSTKNNNMELGPKQWQNGNIIWNQQRVKM